MSSSSNNKHNNPGDANSTIIPSDLSSSDDASTVLSGLSNPEDMPTPRLASRMTRIVATAAADGRFPPLAISAARLAFPVSTRNQPRRGQSQEDHGPNDGRTLPMVPNPFVHVPPRGGWPTDLLPGTDDTPVRPWIPPPFRIWDDADNGTERHWAALYGRGQMLGAEEAAVAAVQSAVQPTPADSTIAAVVTRSTSRTSVLLHHLPAAGQGGPDSATNATAVQLFEDEEEPEDLMGELYGPAMGQAAREGDQLRSAELKKRKRGGGDDDDGGGGDDDDDDDGEGVDGEKGAGGDEEGRMEEEGEAGEAGEEGNEAKKRRLQ